ncbi:unnamed protein product [Larinioides sclopetarius]|uniref:Uncharacterized protein n=1 Tax=Larinioides sclopetarius TaxID=280406 RepID=A0AAV1YYG1_9ARAC
MHLYRLKMYCNYIFFFL